MLERSNQQPNSASTQAGRCRSQLEICNDSKVPTHVSAQPPYVLSNKIQQELEQLDVNKPIVRLRKAPAPDRTKSAMYDFLIYQVCSVA